MAATVTKFTPRIEVILQNLPETIDRTSNFTINIHRMNTKIKPKKRSESKIRFFPHVNTTELVIVCEGIPPMIDLALKSDFKYFSPIVSWQYKTQVNEGGCLHGLQFLNDCWPEAIEKRMARMRVYTRTSADMQFDVLELEHKGRTVRTGKTDAGIEIHVHSPQVENLYREVFDEKDCCREFKQIFQQYIALPSPDVNDLALLLVFCHHLFQTKWNKTVTVSQQWVLNICNSRAQIGSA